MLGGCVLDGYMEVGRSFCKAPNVGEARGRGWPRKFHSHDRLMRDGRI